AGVVQSKTKFTDERRRSRSDGRGEPALCCEKRSQTDTESKNKAVADELHVPAPHRVGRDEGQPVERIPEEALALAPEWPTDPIEAVPERDLRVTQALSLYLRVRNEGPHHGEHIAVARIFNFQIVRPRHEGGMVVEHRSSAVVRGDEASPEEQQRVRGHERR